MLELKAPPTLGARRLLSEHGGVRRELAEWQGQAVFVKTLAVDDAASRLRFVHEGRVAAALDHPLIVPLLAKSGQSLVFAHIEGGTLRDRLQAGPLAPEAATEVALAVSRAVAHLHAQGVVHHDLKPENVLLLGGQCRYWHVRLIDFGMSHAARSPLDVHSGTRMGTPHFMAPEQFRGVRGDPRSDVYSLGVLLYDCLAGEPPFADALAWLTGREAAPPPLPGPPALHGLLRAALSRDPAARPAAAEALRSALCRVRSELAYPPISYRAVDEPPCG